MDQKYFDVPFAFGGDQSVVPDATQPDGSVSFMEGFGFDYQRDLATDPLAKPVDRSATNYLFFAITAAIAALQKTGIPEWVTPTQNNGVALAYPKYAQVRYSATIPATTFETYISTVDNNTSVPGADANWQPIASVVAAASDVIAGTSARLPVTPLTLKSYPGNATQTFNVAAATANAHAVRLDQLYGGVKGISRNTVSGSLTVPVGVTTMYVSGTAPGGGGGAGGGGGSTNFCGSGGGSGGAGQNVYRQAFAVTPGQVINFNIGTIGLGGGGNSGGGTAATSGGNIVLSGGITLTLVGGSAGTNGVNGSLSGGGILAGSGPGTGYPSGSWGSDVTLNNASGNGATGASGPFGGGGGAGRAAQGGNALPGGNAAGFGAGGGSGGGIYGGSGSYNGGNGGNGAPGLLIFEW